MLYEFLTTIGQWFIPIFILTIFLHALYKKVPIFDTFVEGAAEGFKVILKILPYVVGIYVAVGLFRGSGALNLLVAPLTPLLALLGIPADVVPLMVIRLLSGPAAMGLTADLISQHGPDSFIGRMVSVLDSSTDTVIYMIAIYFASANVKNARYSLTVGIIGALSGYVATIYICNVIY